MRAAGWRAEGWAFRGGGRPLLPTAGNTAGLLLEREGRGVLSVEGPGCWRASRGAGEPAETET